MSNSTRRPSGPPRLFGIAGYKNAGKTTLIVDLVRDLVARGWRVGTVKHAHHDFDIDHPGKDSHQHRSAGASEVIIASARRVAHIRELAGRPEPTLGELAGRMTGVDLVLAEGWKSGDHPRLELRRAAAPAPAIAGSAPGVLAIVSDAPLPGEYLPVLPRDDVPAIANFILRSVGLPPTGP
ncbi:MAG: molybdopterin-guanine dinucleotide biosynthesis protein B [Chromatiales bacterium]|nr:molybdopterin-guanine dinucleotide biosynthesis protein B [Chromatiales bacterium]